MSKALNLILITLLCFAVSGCVTTSTSRYDKKKDIVKAEKTYIQIGYGHFEKKNMQEAKKALSKALELNPKSGGAHMGLARIYDLELEQDLARDHFKKAIRYDETTEAHFQYGVYLYNQGDLKGAYREFKTVLKDTVYTRRAQSLEYQGIVAKRLGKIDEAIDNYRRAIALNAMLANSHIGLTNIYFEREDYVQSYSAYNGFINLVRAQVARHNASTLWLGIQLAYIQEDSNALSSYSLQLRNLFPDSKEYQSYLDWKADKDAA
jgi:type IV pilus assembly protein PilF